MAARILTADDDPHLRDFIAQGLRENGYVVREAATIAETEQLARSESFDLWVLDRQMPGGDSVAMLRALRATGLATPALLLTASRTVEQRVEGLESGADDYLTKPFSIVELAARARALLRRPPALREVILERGLVSLHLDTLRVFVGAREVIVTANEWRLMVTLAQRPGAVFSRAQIALQVGIAEDAEEVAVDHLVSRLRAKLRQHGAESAIRTVRGIGFSWE